MSPRLRRALFVMAVGAGLGLLLAMTAKLGRLLPAGGPWWASLGATWLAASFAAGALAAERRAGAAAGALVIVAGTCAYYLATLLDWRDGERYVATMALGWSTLGALAGAGFGWAGAVWRRSRATLRGTLAGALVAGALVGEAVLLHRLWDAPWAQLTLALELCLGLVAAVALARRRRVAAVAFALAAAGVLAVAEHVARESLRAAGWAGA